jgi:hypothetical protein
MRRRKEKCGQDRYFPAFPLFHAHAPRKKHMPKKKNKNRKPLNLSPAPRLRAFLEAFVEANDRASVTAVVEEALREYFGKRGHDVDAPPEEVLRKILAKKKGNPAEETLEP